MSETMRDTKPRLVKQNWLTPNSRKPEHGQRSLGTPKMGGTHAHMTRIQNAVEFHRLNVLSQVPCILHTAITPFCCSPTTLELL